MRLIKALIITWSFAAQAGLPPTTLSGQNSFSKPTTFGTQVPYSQATLLGGINSLIETGNENMLVDPGMESADVSAYTCTSGTCTKTSTSGEFSSGKQALKVALSAQAMNVSQTVNTPLGIQKQGYVRVLYRVPATMADFQICSIVNSAEQTCVPTNNLVKDDTFRSIEIPLTFNATNAGIKFKTTSAYTANAYFDAAIVAQGLGTQNLMLDNVYSAQVSAAGVVSGENKDWINGNASIASTSQYTLTFNSGIFTIAPVCALVARDTVARSARIFTAATSSSIVVRTQTPGTDTADTSAFEVICQKSGNDYLASSANVYSSTNGNYSFRSCGLTTSDFTGFGTVSNINVQCSRVGEQIIIKGNFTSGTATGVEARVNLSPGGTLISSSSIGTLEFAQGFWMRDAAAAAHGSATLMEPSVSYITFGNGDGFSGNAVNGTAKMLASSYVASGNVVRFFARVPISGWSNSNVIVGSFAGYTNVPGATGNIDTFSVSFGTTNATTVCSASPCSYLDQIGSAVTSITRSGAGAYAINTTKTYLKLKCQANGNTLTGSTRFIDATACANCSSTTFASINIAGVQSDSSGIISCMGSY